MPHGPDRGPGRALTTENTERYLLFDQYVEFQIDNEQRRGALDDLARSPTG
jgi:hypothetical protein